MTAFDLCSGEYGFYLTNRNDPVCYNPPLNVRDTATVVWADVYDLLVSLRPL
ncbi:hypothetical protein SAMD00023353_1800350 [Rosellinia necatrix]|uniref:Uncharacterized protein n=1 Tax=Rosellinia necatrix TaxID=77044 RepID=A0A1S8A7T3_ROSNE|nr:hypothetical protein SAMD00023353_1800350 [Rosellinia necatrix]